MSSFGQVPLKDVWAMLTECAPGYLARETTHHYRVTYNDRVYPSFPKGAHGKSNPPIERGPVKKLARFLQIEDCAGQYFGW